MEIVEQGEDFGLEIENRGGDGEGVVGVEGVGICCYAGCVDEGVGDGGGLLLNLEGLEAVEEDVGVEVVKGCVEGYDLQRRVVS